jgi:hypothetical protein
VTSAISVASWLVLDDTGPGDDVDYFTVVATYRF